jgi:3-isopropylmalate/(R)-2-methylmalate dehydratase small subunit
MQKFAILTGVAAPLPIDNVDTDMIIAKQYLKTVRRTGLGAGLFAEMRYLDNGAEKASISAHLRWASTNGVTWRRREY